MWNRRNNVFMANKFDNKKKKVLILGGGFAGVGVLNDLQKKLHNRGDKKDNINITLVSENNFMLFTPMLPEIVSGSVESRHIVTPIRSFCKYATFYEASVKSIDLEKRCIIITHKIGIDSNENEKNHDHFISYDYLVIALGSENNFFDNQNIQKNVFTLKTIGDALVLRNHIIKVIKQAMLEKNNQDLRKALLTFVIVGGGFSGVETVGAINDFVRESIKKYYTEIYITDIRIVLVNATDKILEQTDEKLGSFELEKLRINGVEFIMNSKVKDVTQESAVLDNDDIISCYSVIWTTGVAPNSLIKDLRCEHDKKHRIITNSYLEVSGYEGIVYALGDCACIINPHTGKPYPPTAQHAIRQSTTVSNNIAYSLMSQMGKKGVFIKRKKFDYKTKGMMAEIGKRTGVAILFDRIKFHGFSAWLLWRIYYLMNLPTARKKLKVMMDWAFDLIYEPDVSQIR